MIEGASEIVDFIGKSVLQQVDVIRDFQSSSLYRAQKTCLRINKENDFYRRNLQSTQSYKENDFFFLLILVLAANTFFAPFTKRNFKSRKFKNLQWKSRITSTCCKTFFPIKSTLSPPPTPRIPKAESDTRIDETENPIQSYSKCIETNPRYRGDNEMPKTALYPIQGYSKSVETNTRYRVTQNVLRRIPNTGLLKTFYRMNDTGIHKMSNTRYRVT